jgi:hypothetical protein
LDFPLAELVRSGVLSRERALFYLDGLCATMEKEPDGLDGFLAKSKMMRTELVELFKNEIQVLSPLVLTCQMKNQRQETEREVA